MTMPTVPSRTTAEREQALAKALETRRERARVRSALRDRSMTPVEVIEGASLNPVWAGLKVSWLLESVPGIGPVRAERLMASLAIAPSRRVQGLGERQRASLLAALGGRS